MKGTKLYQICCEGSRKSFNGIAKFHSKKVYLDTPTPDQIESFVDSCCNSKFPHNLYDLKREGLIVKILELEIS